MKHKNNTTINISYYAILGIVLLFCVMIVKLVYVSEASLVDGVNIKAIANSRYMTTQTLTASRGNIISSDGEILAQDVNSYTVIAYIDENRTTNPERPRHVVDKEYTANVLSEYLNMSAEYIFNLLSYKGYQVELGPGGRNISERLKEEIAALDLPGIDFIKSTKRYYPFGDFASYLIGYAKKRDNGSIVGELGVEAYYNSVLTGKNGYTTYQRDAYGYQIADTPVTRVEAESGKDVYLTIDSNVQMFLENALEEMGQKAQYEWATVTIADAKTGAILGSASTPSYNPNILNIYNYNNPLVSYSYEPGSTMKIYSFMAAMEEGLYDGEELYPSGVLKVGKDSLNDWNKTGWGEISYDRGFMYSSNVAAALLGLEMGRNTLVDYYNLFGFGKKTGIEIFNEYNGVVNPVYDLEIANVAFGQGLTTTPIQHVQALTSLANEGMVIKPYIVEKIIDHETGKVEYQNERVEIGQAVSKETVDKMLELMYLTVNGPDSGATGKVYQTSATSLIGKTGTAQIAQNGSYLTGSYNNIRSFAGLFPYDEPQYIIYFAVKKLVGSSSTMAVPVKSIVESIAKHKNLDDLIANEDESLIIKVDNYINKNAEEVYSKLKEQGLEVVKIGNGKVVIDQYPMKGSSILKGNKIFIRTNSIDMYMPNMIGWTSSEAGAFCNILDMNYSVSGYGTIIEQSVLDGTLIDLNAKLEFVLSRGNDEGED